MFKIGLFWGTQPGNNQTVADLHLIDSFKAISQQPVLLVAEGVLMYFSEAH